MKTLYAIPSYKCNLNCPHCEVSNQEFDESFMLFMGELQAAEAENIVLFGGEPLINKRCLWEILKLGKVNTISTNLTLWEPGLEDIFKQANVSIATSWNPHRFSVTQYKKWLRAIGALTSKDVPVRVLITLTRDLFEMDMQDVLDIFMDMEKAGADEFLFEHYVGENECNEEADEWLCRFHDESIGNIKMTNLIEERLTNWQCNCDDVWTLEPSGELRKGCPQLASGVHVVNECLYCDKVGYCRPCVLQRTCSYPKKLAAKLGIK